ncbi:MAG: bifunctional (p)ppGpp synthetase/guanosine-3',5'-bis(diphosphate) 3'-pyrophosphohydrolase [Pseudomonadota bacterium]
MNQISELSTDSVNETHDSGVDLLIAKLSEYLPPEQIPQVRDAYKLADKAHHGQVRKSGEPYVHHPVAVARILADMRMDSQTICAAILHDVIEDTEYTKEDLSTQFGDTIAELVDGVSKLTQIQFETKAEAQAENLQKMAMAMAKDIRVILIKLADRLHNVRTLACLPTAKKKRIAKETLDIYSPLALRLGINVFRNEYEDRCFKAIYPMRSKRILAALKKTHGERQEFLDEICEQVSQTFEAHGLNVEVRGRHKHLYSIYMKMKRKRKSLSDILDVYGCRIIVDNEDDCYRALGICHRLFKPITQQFKDYIAIPKANGYQSLHTTVFGLRVPIEIQIRTKDMEQMAERGIASHWLYKNGQDPNEEFAPKHLRTKKWLHGVQEIHEQSVDSKEFVEHFKTNLFSDEVYVFTPKGDILELPQGATLVDFAYAVHTDVGNRCVSGTVNRRPASLSQILESGQTVKVTTSDEAHPIERWLKFVVTGKARSNIRHYLNKQRHAGSVDLGRRLLNKTLQAFNLPVVDELSEAQVNCLLSELSHESMDDILEDIGLGNRPEYLIVNLLENARPASDNADEKPSSTSTKQPLLISATEGMMVNFAKCCYPLPGDKISGCAVGGRGIDVHLQSCGEFKGLLRKGKHRIDLHWEDSIQQMFSVAIFVKIENKINAVAFLASRLDQYGAQIEHIQQLEKEQDLKVIRIELQVENRIYLARIMRLLRNNRVVLSVVRQK